MKTASLIGGKGTWFVKEACIRPRLILWHIINIYVMIWDAATKWFSFTKAHGSAAKRSFAALLDLSSRKHGRIAFGAGLPVFLPNALPEFRPDLTLIWEPFCEAVIAIEASVLGLVPDFAV